MNFTQLVIINNWPYIILVASTVLSLIASRFFKNISSVLRILAMFLFLIQITWQICMGAKFLEILMVIIIEAIVFYATMPSLKKDIEKNKDNMLEEQK